MAIQETVKRKAAEKKAMIEQVEECKQVLAKKQGVCNEVLTQCKAIQKQCKRLDLQIQEAKEEYSNKEEEKDMLDAHVNYLQKLIKIEYKNEQKEQKKKSFLKEFIQYGTENNNIVS